MFVQLVVDQAASSTEMQVRLGLITQLKEDIFWLFPFLRSKELRSLLLQSRSVILELFIIFNDVSKLSEQFKLVSDVLKSTLRIVR